MRIFKIIMTIILAIFMMYGGINHFMNPEFYDAFIPQFFPKLISNYAAGLVEIALGAGLLWPKIRYYAAYGIVILLILLLPIHIWDFFKESPAIGSKTVAMIRIPIQFLLMLWAWWLRGEKPVN